MTVLAVASGKGGTGKSSLTSSLALALDRVTAIDADVEEPNLAPLLGLDPVERGQVSIPIPLFGHNCVRCGECAKACRFNAIVQFGSLAPTVNKGLCHGCAVCSMVCPVGAITETPNVIGTVSEASRGNLRLLEGRLKVGSPNPVPVIRSVIEAGSTDSNIKIVDCPPGTSCSMVEAVSRSDYVLLVTEGTPFGMADLELALEVVSDLKRPASVVVNRFDLGGSDPEELCRRFNVKVISRIPFSKKVAQIYGIGENLYLKSELWRGHTDGIVCSLRERGVF
nr:ATP-binding protein [uncultured Dethiosulfovibrio sp.]